MTDTRLLNDIFIETARIELEEHNNGRKKVVLIEHGTEGSQLEILNIPQDSLVIDVDSSFDNTKLCRNIKGACKRSDYLIISEDKELILFIEMKKGTNSTRPDIIKQLKGSLCVFEYCQSIAREFHDTDNFLHNYRKCFIAFKNVNLAKTQTKVTKIDNNHSTPETLKTISGTSNIQFNQIAAR